MQQLKAGPVKPNKSAPAPHSIRTSKRGSASAKRSGGSSFDSRTPRTAADIELDPEDIRRLLEDDKDFMQVRTAV